MKWLRRLIERIVREAVELEAAARREQCEKLITELHELRLAYIERYDEERGSGLPAEVARLETRVTGLATDILDLVKRSAEMELMLRRLAGGDDRVRQAAIDEYRAELIGSNPDLAPYPD